MNQILVLLLGAGFLYVLVYKPSLALVVFFTMTIAAVNFEMPGVSVNVRPVIAGCLLLRSLFHGQTSPMDFLSRPPYRMVLLFFAYIFLLSWGRETLYSDNIRLLSLSVVTAYLGYYAYMLRDDAGTLKLSIALAGLICVADLAYTYMFIGNFPVQRLYYLIFPDAGIMEELNDTNHNFYGFIAGIAFVMLFSDHINRRNNYPVLTVLLLPVMLMGVLMSTSRSALLGLVMASAFIAYKGLGDPYTRKRTTAMISAAFALLFFVVIGFMAIQSVLELDSAFISNISLRLVEEPVAVMRKYLGLSYNVQDLDAMDWRSESASLAWKAYAGLGPGEQLLGVGIGGYLQRDLGQNGLNPHNGILYILVECGLVGFLIYFLNVFSIIRQALKKRPVSSLLLVLVFIMFYSLGQNEELISATALLFISTLIMENEMAGDKRPATRNNVPVINIDQRRTYGRYRSHAG